MSHLENKQSKDRTVALPASLPASISAGRSIQLSALRSTIVDIVATTFDSHICKSAYPFAMADTKEPDISSLLAQINNLGKSLSSGSKQDAEVRKKLRLAARDLTRAMEEPGDTVERVCYSVSDRLPRKLYHLPRPRS